jgi:hypothetical protein
MPCGLDLSSSVDAGADQPDSNSAKISLLSDPLQADNDEAGVEMELILHHQVMQFI